MRRYMQGSVEPEEGTEDENNPVIAYVPRAPFIVELAVLRGHWFSLGLEFHSPCGSDIASG